MWYGPDTYMGRNLAELFLQLSVLPDDVVQQLHPAHTAASIKALLPRLRHYASGTCIVHHIFGGETCELVRQVSSTAADGDSAYSCCRCCCAGTYACMLQRKALLVAACGM